MATTAAPTVDTRRGRVRGTTESGIAVFRGIPYAAAPVGPLRFAAPERAPSWEGVRETVQYGPTLPKPPYAAPFDRLLEEPVVPGRDGLNLNVWTPDPGADGLPVLVWIHGGSFRNGTGAIAIYDGGAFARDGVVCVTINYRLGFDGFGLVEDATPNRGLLDQIAALEWVREEVASFGGDPGNVTVAGESAGGMSVAMLLSMPRARGLFRRVIAQSGAGHHAQSPDSARRVGAELGRRLGVSPTAAGFADVDLARFVSVQSELSDEITGTDRERWGALGLDVMAYEPVIDGEVLPARPIEALAAGEGADVPVLVGSNAEEYRFWLVPLGVIDHMRDEHVATAAAAMGLPAERLDVYADAGAPGERLEALICDWFFRIPALRVAETRWSGGPRAAPVHVYEFAWRSPQFGGRLGACHVIEVPFVFDRLATPTAHPLTGPHAPQALADETHAAWVAFATHGDPGWSAYDPERRSVRTFGGVGGVVEDPRAARRRAWDGVR